MESAYQIFITQDGSPTLIWPGHNGAEEKMHHSAGALSESFFIYHAALHEMIERDWPVRVLSLGLGLGYNELIALGEIQKIGFEDWKIWSFEASELLRQSFREWLESTHRNDPLHSAYDRVLNGVAANLERPAADLKAFARAALVENRLELLGRFPEAAGAIRDCSCIFYDAFSKKMNPELWVEDDLLAQLAKISGPGCVLATYACTGSLNRALKRLGFRLTAKKGFSGKRESTLAIREWIR